MKKPLILLALSLLVITNSKNLFSQNNDTLRNTGRNESVMAAEWTDNYIPKWLFNEKKSPLPILGNSIMVEKDNMIMIAPLEFISTSEKLRVYGRIGLYRNLDFKTVDATISFGSKIAGNLSFIGNGETMLNIMTLNGGTGFVGIGTQSPEAMLHVKGKILTNSLDATNIYSVSTTTKLLNAENVISTGIIANEITTKELNSENITSVSLNTQTLKVTENSQNGAVLTSDDFGNATWQLLPEMPESLWTNSLTNDDIYRMDGNVGIGTSNTSGFKLSVNGNIQAELIKIIENVPASDFVFENDYELMPLYELEQFVADNKHLPEVKSAEEFKEEGYNIGDMDDVLLRKVEELTLYTIEQQKQIDSQNALILRLMQKLDMSENSIDANSGN
jgi:hypothetical protein